MVTRMVLLTAMMLMVVLSVLNLHTVAGGSSRIVAATSCRNHLLIHLLCWTICCSEVDSDTPLDWLKIDLRFVFPDC